MRVLIFKLLLLTPMFCVAGGNLTPEQTKVAKLDICGAIDDNSPFNAAGNCLKVNAILDSDDNKSKWFTSTPSLKVMNALGYIKQDDADNTGESYAKLLKEDGISGPIAQFARFRQDGKDMVEESTTDDGNYGLNGQFDRWCKKLAKIKFADKVNWRRPTEDELYQLVSYGYTDDADMFSRFGWPIRVYYGSSSYRSSEYMHTQIRVVPLDGYSSITYSADYPAYASCVSVQ